MTTLMRRLASLIGFSTWLVMPLASGAQQDNECFWAEGAGPVTYTPRLGTLYVPRDAPVGTLIGSEQSLFTPNDEGGRIECRNDGSTILNFSAIASAPIYIGPIPPQPGTVLHTNIPGVGVLIKLGRPLVKEFNEDNSFTALNGPYVPMLSEHRQSMGSANFSFGSLRHTLTLIKIGPIAPGVHILNGSTLFSGHFTGIGKAFSYGLDGTVIQSQCSLSSTPVSADPVQLGHWDSKHFTQEGDTTDAVDFHINMVSCETDPSGESIALAHIRLEGAKGSVPFDPVNGIFTLATSATAKGVGIQMLKEDGLTPVPLGVDVPIVAITPGNMAMHFKARLYQTHPTINVEPGSVEGALNFTLTYK